MGSGYDGLDSGAWSSDRVELPSKLDRAMIDVPLPPLSFRLRCRLASTLLRQRVRSFREQLVDAAAAAFAQRVGEHVRRRVQRAWDEADAQTGPGPATETGRPHVVFFDPGSPETFSFLQRRREQYVHEQVLDPHRTRDFAELARAWKKASPHATNLSMLPRAESGEIEWALAGPWCFRELPFVQFILMRVLGVDERLAQALGKRVINEWHDLEPDTGLTDDERDLLRMEPAKENRA